MSLPPLAPVYRSKVTQEDGVGVGKSEEGEEGSLLMLNVCGLLILVSVSYSSYQTMEEATVGSYLGERGELKLLLQL